jgi:tetratricopeptide (TPR) repeat protein
MPEKPPALKPLSKGGIEAALERAERYRLLNEPSQAESICLDILDVDPENERAVVLLLLAITDTFSESTEGAPRALALLPRLRGEYNHAYYEGLIFERHARAIVGRGGPGSGYRAHASLMQAMKSFERAEGLRPADNDDSILRYNACVRLLGSTPSIQEAPKADPSDLLE